MRLELHRAKLLLLLLALVTACAPTGKSQWATRLQPAPPAVSLRPSAPPRVVWLHAQAASVPPKGPAGDAWDEDGSGPDPLVVLLLDDEEILRFAAVADTFSPTWSDQPGGNIALDKARSLRIELRDADGLSSQLVGIKNLNLDGLRGSPVARTVQLRPFGRVTLAIEPAHALIGVGLDYRRHGGAVVVTDTLSYGPAARAGIARGDKLVQLAGKKVRGMPNDELKSIFNAVPVAGVQMTVWHRKQGTTETVTLVEGPIYALLSEYGPVP